MEMDKPTQIIPKRVKWGRKVGSVSTGRPGIPAGELYYMAYQKAAGRTSNSATVGRRRTRFYQGRFKSSLKRKG